MDRALVEKRMAEYEYKLKQEELVVLRLQGAVAALKGLLAETEKQEGADGDNQRLRDASGDSGAAGD